MPHRVLASQSNRAFGLAEVIFLLAAPVLSYWLMHFHPVMQNGFLDPYVYTGYIHNFADLAARYGRTYYSVRFGTIVPGQIATFLFGPMGGYFAVRYVMALLAGVSLYALAKQRYGRPTAIAVLSLLMTSPFLARTLLWDYPDSTGVPFIFAAICLYSIEHPKRRLLDSIAGVLAGLAIHSNVFTLTPLGVFFGVHALLWIARGRGVSPIVRRLLPVAAGVVAVTIAGVLYYWVRTGRPDIFSVTLNMSRSLLGGTLANWRTPGVGWVAQQWWVLILPVLVVLAPLAWGRRRIEFEDAVFWISGAAITLFYYCYQFLFEGTFLQLFYYFSYTLPFVFLLLTLIVSSLLQRVDMRSQWLSAALLAAAAIVPWIAFSFEQRALLTEHIGYYVAIVGITFVLVILGSRVSPEKRVMRSLALVALGLMFANTFSGQIYSGCVNSRVHPAHLELDIYRIALRLIQAVPPLSQQRGEIRFWYSNEPPNNAMQSIQSTYLWGFSKVQGEAIGAGLPNLDASGLEAIRGQHMKWLALLAEKEEQLAQGRAALLQRDVPHSVVDRRVLTEGSYTLYVEFLELDQQR